MDIEEPEKELRKWDWIVGGAQYLPFRDSCFDKVIASHVIEHLDDPIMFLKEVRRILKIGGRLTLILPQLFIN
ncbi:MAG: class I SAM-dependent methyltransferase [Thermoprotei archaeon]|nr:class I SAM-dependent methyltransferase [Thermoprotei archaeon]